MRGGLTSLLKMRMPSLIWILQLMDLAKGLAGAKALRYRRGSSVSRSCPAGCATCSAPNGCLSCKPRFFFHLEMDGMRQRGACLSLCPRGHYGTRSPRISTCNRCKEDCASCFSENFCTRCHPGHFLLRGKCESSCPTGLTANTAMRECTDCPTGCEMCTSRSACVRCRADLYALSGNCHPSCPAGFEPDVQLMQCSPRVQCEVGEWSEWSPCVRRRGTRAYRKGEKTRTRDILTPPGNSSDPCPHVSEFRKCVVKKRPSPKRL